jgi:hypothetical protein
LPTNLIYFLKLKEIILATIFINGGINQCPILKSMLI